MNVRTMTNKWLLILLPFMKAGKFLSNMWQPKNHTYMGMKIPQHIAFEALNWGPETARNLGPHRRTP